jgi:hypothetical protein
MRSACTNLISEKSLRLSPKSLVDYGRGQITSAIGTDCNYIQRSYFGMVQAIVQPITIVIGLILLLLNLGPSALVVSDTSQGYLTVSLRDTHDFDLGTGSPRPDLPGNDTTIW